MISTASTINNADAVCQEGGTVSARRGEQSKAGDGRCGGGDEERAQSRACEETQRNCDIGLRCARC